MRELFLIVIVYLFYSCNQNQEAGFKIVIECTIPEPYTIELTEKDFVKVDWSNQEYYLQKGILDNPKFNIKVCFGACRLKAFLNGYLRYEAVLFCDVAPNSLPTRNRNAIFIKAGDEKLNLFYNNKLQLNLNDRIKLTDNAEKQKKLSSFLYDKEIKKYLEQKFLIKE